MVARVSQNTNAFIKRDTGEFFRRERKEGGKEGRREGSLLTLTLLFPFLSPRASCNVADAVQMLSSISCLVCSSHFLCLYMLEIARSVSQSVSFVLAFNLGQGIKCSLHECHLSRLFWLSDFGAVVLGGLSLKGYDPHKIMDRNLQALVFSSAVSRFQHRAIEKYQMAILLWQPHIPFFWPICLLNLRGGRSG